MKFISVCINYEANKGVDVELGLEIKLFIWQSQIKRLRDFLKIKNYIKLMSIIRTENEEKKYMPETYNDFLFQEKFNVLEEEKEFLLYSKQCQFEIFTRKIWNLLLQ
jgi:hypothetical protein